MEVRVACLGRRLNKALEAGILLSSPLVLLSLREIGELAIAKRLPLISLFGEFLKSRRFHTLRAEPRRLPKVRGLRRQDVLHGASQRSGANEFHYRRIDRCNEGDQRSNSLDQQSRRADKSAGAQCSNRVRTRRRSRSRIWKSRSLARPRRCRDGGFLAIFDQPSGLGIQPRLAFQAMIRTVRDRPSALAFVRKHYAGLQTLRARGGWMRDARRPAPRCSRCKKCRCINKMFRTDS
jgi:hypothetical protein